MDFDAIVVGAGAVGLACGYALAKRGRATLVLEAEAGIGQGASSRNSEVIHAGFFYEPGSLKARLCAEGRRMLYPFLEAHAVAHRKCGKLVVATQPEHVARLHAIAARGGANGIEGLRRLSGARAQALEPGLFCLEALLSQESGIFDSHGYMLALQGEIEASGGAVVARAPVVRIEPLRGGFRVHVGGAEPSAATARGVIIAAGLSAQAVAARTEGYPADAIPRLHYGKGVYFRLRGQAPFERLIYPPPIPGALGVHYRRDLGGQAVFGPDLTFVDAPDYRVDPAAAPRFEETIRTFWPSLPAGALTPDYAGVRPKLHGPGEPQPDFRIDGPGRHGVQGLVALFGIESPGLTASLAIGEHAATLMES